MEKVNFNNQIYSKVLMIFALFIFLGLGLFKNMWGSAWIVFPIVALISYILKLVGYLTNHFSKK